MKGDPVELARACKATAAKAKRAVAKAFPVGRKVSFRWLGKRLVVGEVTGYAFHRTTGEPVVCVLPADEPGPHPASRMLHDVPVNRLNWVKQGS